MTKLTNLWDQWLKSFVIICQIRFAVNTLHHVVLFFLFEMIPKFCQFLPFTATRLILCHHSNLGSLNARALGCIKIHSSSILICLGAQSVTIHAKTINAKYFCDTWCSRGGTAHQLLPIGEAMIKRTVFDIVLWCHFGLWFQCLVSRRTRICNSWRKYQSKKCKSSEKKAHFSFSHAVFHL